MGTFWIYTRHCAWIVNQNRRFSNGIDSLPSPVSVWMNNKYTPLSNDESLNRSLSAYCPLPNTYLYGFSFFYSWVMGIIDVNLALTSIDSSYCLACLALSCLLYIIFSVQWAATFFFIWLLLVNKSFSLANTIRTGTYSDNRYIYYTLAVEYFTILIWLIQVLLCNCNK